MDLPDLVFDAEHKNLLAIIVVSFTAVMPQRTVRPSNGPSVGDPLLILCKLTAFSADFYRVVFVA